MTKRRDFMLDRPDLRDAGIDAENSPWLQPGDVALVPHGNSHRLQSEPGVPVPNIFELDLQQPSERFAILRHGDGGAPTTLMCGAVRLTIRRRAT